MVLEEIATIIPLIICPLSQYYSNVLPSSQLILFHFTDEVNIKPNCFSSVSKHQMLSLRKLFKVEFTDLLTLIFEG